MPTIAAAELGALTPAILVLALAVLVLLLDVFAKPATDRAYAAWLTAVGLVAAAVAGLLIGDAGTGGKPIFFGALAVDGTAVFTNTLILLSAAAIALISSPFVAAHATPRGEYYALLLLAVLGALLLAAATDLLAMFMALETMSIALYVLAGYQRTNDRSVEAALKYFITGAFSSAFLLYGIAFVYGAVGGTNYADVHAAVADAVKAAAQGSDPGAIGTRLLAAQPFLVFGMLLLLAGFFFKIAAVPFHMWAPDVYEGSPSPVTALMAATVKAASVVALVRTVVVPFVDLQTAYPGWGYPVFVVAAATMIVGNLGALMQDNIKRLLAYSSVAHAGYLLVGVLAVAEPAGRTLAGGVLFYLLVYTVLTIGTFAVIVLFGSERGENTSISRHYAGLGWRRPWLGLAMLVFMFGLTGMPPTAGFFAKFYVFAAAVKAGYVNLAIIGMLTSLVSAYYYLKVIVYLYFREPREASEGLESKTTTAVALACAALVLGLGVVGAVYGWADTAAGGLFALAGVR